MIFKNSNEEESAPEVVSVTLKNGEQTEHYSCSFAACEDPRCTCEELTVHFSLEQIDGETASPLQHSIMIDLIGKKPVDQCIESVSEESIAFSKRLFSQLNEEDFNYLGSLYLDIKIDATLKADIENIEFEFNSHAIETKGLMIALKEVIPYLPPIAATINNETCILLDKHCLSSDCDCTETNLTVISKAPTKNRADERCVVQVDYTTRSWIMVENHSMMVSLDTLKKAVEEENDPFYERLRCNHLILKTIYLNNKQRLLKKQTKSLSKPKRNDPCPCGSGNKYKKCCL